MHTTDKHYNKQQQQLSAVKPALLLAALAIFLLPVGALPQQAGQPVSLYLNVEADNGLVEGLKADNFSLLQDGKPQEFKLEQPEKPAAIALLVEDSQSSWVYYNDIDAAMQGFSNSAPDGNWYALATFSNGLKIRVDFTKSAGRVEEAYSELGQPAWDEVDTYDAIYEMLDKMGRMSGRRVLIVIGSGMDTFSSHTLEDVQKKAEETNVLIYGVSLGTGYRGTYNPYLSNSQRMDLLMAENFFRTLADYSGGQAWFPNEEGAYPDILKGVFEDLKYQYKLVYTPTVPADGKFHKISVEAKGVLNGKQQDFKVRVRKGWRF